MPSIRTLIREHRDRTGQSLRELERASTRAGRRSVSHQRWKDFEDGQFDQFPLPETIDAVAATLGVDVTDVVLGFAVELGFPVRGVVPFPLPPGAERLDEGQRRLVFELVRNYLSAQGGAAAKVVVDTEAIIAANEPGVVERNAKRSRRGDVAAG